MATASVPTGLAHLSHINVNGNYVQSTKTSERNKLVRANPPSEAKTKSLPLFSVGERVDPNSVKSADPFL